jgi:plastocyanin
LETIIMKLRYLFCKAIMLLVASASASAANTDVTLLGGSAMKFSPADFAINAGDTVTFHYGGGILPHNVRADDGSFRCAKTCSGTGANATTDKWDSVVTFPTAGSFNYYCEIHGAPGHIGMAGRITVNAAAPPPTQSPPPSISLGGYLSGNWFNPGQSGHGFQLEFTTTNDMIGIWFVYSPDGTAQSWIFAQGPFDPTKDSVTLPAEILTGAKFPPHFNSADVHQLGGALWGNVTFAFSDCNNGTVRWHSTVPGYDQANDIPLPIQRLTQIGGTTCPQ